MKLPPLIILLFAAAITLASCSSNRSASAAVSVSSASVDSDSVWFSSAHNSTHRQLTLLNQHLDSALISLSADSLVTPSGLRFYAPRFSRQEWGSAASLRSGSVCHVSDSVSVSSRALSVDTLAVEASRRDNSETRAVAQPPDLTAITIAVAAIILIILAVYIFFRHKLDK